MELDRYTVDSSVEKQILTGMIVSDDFLRDVGPSYDPSYLKNSFTRRVAGWVIDYWGNYRLAPKKNIEAIYEAERERIDKDESTLIAIYLSHLSHEFESLEAFNTEYHIRQALRYFKKREIEIRARNAIALIEKDKVEDAEAEMSGLKQISRVTSSWYNPFEQRYVAEVFSRKEEFGLRLPGDFGNFIGPMQFGWTVMIAGKYKGLKSHYCNEIAYIASSSNIPTAYLSFEMMRPDINERMYKRITAYGEEQSNIYVYPCFDCEHNQTGACNRDERQNRHTLIENDQLPQFSLDNPYRKCTWCRKNDPESYSPSTWFEAVERPKFNYDNTFDTITEYGKFYGNDFLRVNCYPRFGASVNDAFRDLDLLEHVHGFVPKVVVWDQPEITRTDSNFKSDWEGINNIWMRIVGRAAEKGFLLVAPSQVTTEALYAEKIRRDKIGRARQILGHIDIGLAINITGDDAKKEMVRIGLLEHRHKKYHDDDECIVLRQLDVGQTHLDSLIRRG